MKNCFGAVILITFFGMLCLPSCRKTEIPRSGTPVGPVTPLPPTAPPPPPPPSACGNRSVINVTLLPVGNLSSARLHVRCASAGKKILFIGGWHSGQNWWNEPVPVDIYDISNNSWSTHFLLPDNPQFTHFRFGAGVASVENKVLIAGGGDAFGDNQTSKVDIYDASTNTWTAQHLSVARENLAAATVGNKVLFAGGFGYPYGNSTWGSFSTVDIYDNSSNTWSTASLSQPRMDITATTSGSKVYFAGGREDMGVSNTIDIYDAATSSWSVSSMQYPRTNMASISVDDKIYWAGGGHSFTSGAGWTYNKSIEILNSSTGSSFVTCLTGKNNFAAVRKDDYIIFFTGDYSDGSSGTEFEIYNIRTDTWSIGKLSQKIFNAAVISVNNTIYVAGGYDGNSFLSQVWKLEF